MALFEYLSQEALDYLATQLRLLSHPEGHIIRDGDPADGLYIIRSGVCRVTKTAKTSEAEAVLAILREGDSFGEIGLIDGLPRAADVTAIEPTDCYFLARDAFFTALEKHPEIAVRMLPTLAAMVRSADQWIAQLL